MGPATGLGWHSPRWWPAAVCLAPCRPASAGWEPARLLVLASLCPSPPGREGAVPSPSSQQPSGRQETWVLAPLATQRRWVEAVFMPGLLAELRFEPRTSWPQRPALKSSHRQCQQQAGQLGRERNSVSSREQPEGLSGNVLFWPVLRWPPGVWSAACTCRAAGECTPSVRTGHSQWEGGTEGGGGGPTALQNEGRWQAGRARGSRVRP